MTAADSLDVTGDTTLTGSLTANGDVTLGDAAADTVTVNGAVRESGSRLAALASAVQRMCGEGGCVVCVDVDWACAVMGVAYVSLRERVVCVCMRL